VSEVVVHPRRRLLDALVAIIAESGLDGVSIREVAAAAGVSIGTVQYYCRSKDEMLVMTFQHITERILGRVTAIDKTGAAGPALRRALLEFLPLDELRRTEARVYLAFAARAAVSAELADVQGAMLSGIRTQCAEAFRRARRQRETRVDLDPAETAMATTALVDGLLLHLLTDPTGLSPEAAVAVLDAHLRQHLVVAST
jgi:AcrR family transcriptional regulator